MVFMTQVGFGLSKTWNIEKHKNYRNACKDPKFLDIRPKF